MQPHAGGSAGARGAMIMLDSIAQEMREAHGIESVGFLDSPYVRARTHTPDQHRSRTPYPGRYWVDTQPLYEWLVSLPTQAKAIQKLR